MGAEPVRDDKNWLTDAQYRRLLDGLEEIEAEEREVWGGVNEGMVLRYFDGQSDPKEKAHVDTSIAEYEAVAEWVDLARKVMPPRPRRRRPWLISVTAAALFLLTSLVVVACVWKGGRVPNGAAANGMVKAGSPLGMIIPLYLYPDQANAEEWNRVLDLGNRGVPIKVIIGAGLEKPGEGEDLNYRAMIDHAHRRGIEVLGAVNCETVEKGWKDVDGWNAMYKGLDGLFYANQPPGKDKIEPVAALYRHAKALDKNWQLVGCPLGRIDEAFLTQTGADIVCAITPGAPPGWGWEAKHDRRHFASIMDRVTDRATVHDCVLRAMEKNYGWIYVTGPKPSPPPYLEEEFRVIQNLNEVVLK